MKQNDIRACSTQIQHFSIYLPIYMQRNCNNSKGKIYDDIKAKLQEMLQILKLKKEK